MAYGTDGLQPYVQHFFQFALAYREVLSGIAEVVSGTSGSKCELEKYRL